MTLTHSMYRMPVPAQGRRWVLRLTLAAAAGGIALGRDAAGAGSALAALRAGGHVGYMRHAITDRSQVDTGRLGDRAGQRNLSPEGRAQAAAIGRALATLGVPVGAVLTSAVFRARDTADLAFGPGRAEVVPELVADDYEPDPARVAANARWIARRLATLSRTGATDLLIGHIVPLGLVLGRPLGADEFPEGAIAVFRPEAGEARHIGFLQPPDLLGAARPPG